MKKIVVKMRNLKKMLGNELLQLALMLSLLKIDPEMWLNTSASSNDLFNGTDYLSGQQQQNSDDVWTQTRFGDDFSLGGLGGGDMSPRLHPKSMDSVLERFQNEILEDLNSLGRYNRVSSFRGVPVEISAYIVNTENSGPGSSSGQAPSSGGSGRSRENSDSDSGISDTDMAPSGEDSESEKEDDRNATPDLLPAGLEEVELPSPLLLMGEDDLDEELARGPVVDPSEVLLDEDVLESHLLQIDDQLITIDENLDELSDEFLHLDEQLAAHISEEEDDSFVDGLLLQGVDFQATPFDEWQRDVDRGIEEFGHLPNDLFSDAEKEKEKETSETSQLENGFQPEESFKSEPSPFQQQPQNSSEQLDLASPTTPADASSSSTSQQRSREASDNAAVSETSEELAGAAAAPVAVSASQWTGEGKFEQANLEDFFGSQAGQPEGLLRNVSMSQAQFNESFGSASGGASAFGGPTTSQTGEFEGQSGIDNFSLPTNEADLMKELSRMLGSRETHDVENSGWNRHSQDHLENAHGHFDSTSTSTEAAVAAATAAGAAAVASSFHAAAAASTSQYLPPPSIYPGYGLPGPSGSSQASSPVGRYGAHTPYTPMLNHSYAASASAMPPAAVDNDDTGSVKSGRSSRSRQYSVDSTSIKDDPDSIDFKFRQSRDEKKAAELGVPFSIHDIINLPMDEFNDMLSRHELNEEQLNLCRDIRRRGKNKVAAQNCRKRKIDQISQLSQQVQETRLRKQRLLQERDMLFRERSEWTNKLMKIQEDVLEAMDKNAREWALDLEGPTVGVVRRAAMAGGSSGSDRLDQGYHHSQGSGSSSFSAQNRSLWKRGTSN